MEIEAARHRGALLRLPPMGVLWSVMTVLVAVYAAHQGLGVGGRGADGLFDRWINSGLLWCSAVASAAAAARTERSRIAWLLVALALTSWAVGDTVWSIRFGGTAAPPSTSVSDIFWLAWYPLIIAAMILLVRERVPGFELHRWLDGIAVMLLVATPWVALFLQPVAEHSSVSGLAVVLDFTYPVADAVLVGAVLGVFALVGWRPGRMWLILGLALVVMGIADAISSVQALAYVHDRGVFDAAWAAAALLVAYAAWQPHPGRQERREVTGFRAIALAVAAQLLAAGIQVYGLFDEVPHSERVLTVIVLLIATVQIVISRPRPTSGPETCPGAPAPPAAVTASERRQPPHAGAAAPVDRGGDERPRWGAGPIDAGGDGA